METLKDERLEQLSNKVRMGIPIGFMEALEVIEYQENIKKNKKKSFVRRIIDWFNYA
jgi:hypothetical protein